MTVLKHYNAVNDFIRKSPHIAIYYKNEMISYDKLYNNVVKYSHILSAMFDKGDEFYLKMSDRPEYFYIFWGAVKAGIIPHLINPKTTMELNPFMHVIDDDNIPDHIAGDDKTDITADTLENDICFVLYTSGTSGFPQKVPHTHRDMVFTSINYAKKTILLNAYDITFSAAKLYFAYGFGNSMTFPLFVGASTVLMSEPSTAKNTLDIIEKYKPTVYFGVPSIYAYQLKAKDRDLSSLRLCISAGEALPGKIKTEWEEKHNVPILDGIGTTEALHIFISNRPENHEPNCSGIPVSGYKVKIDAKDGEPGPLYIRGGSFDGWLKTGDQFIKKNNKFYYQGRTNDIIKVGGVWVAPNIIESKINEHPDIIEAAVVQSTDKNGLHVPKAYLITKNIKNEIKLKNELKRMCIDNLPPNYFPKQFEIVDRLPKTDTGKIMRSELRKNPTRSNH